ncbi:MAG TPA: oligopeptide transporter, OPT family [Bryobacteraceae bacterium]|nr:oligopeptide transporter, OPT family [Bryobacteraceae bacterium]
MPPISPNSPPKTPSNPERELTPKAILLGLLLAFVFGAANAYLGMKAGQTVAATIPAAVIAMTVFRIPALRGGLLEMNIARTAGSVGEALVSGAIFVIPSFLMVEMDGHPLWANLRQHYWQASMLLVTGGMLGVLFTVLIRRPLFADKSLPWPESVASVEVLRAGVNEGHSNASRLIFGSMAFGGLIQVLKDSKGLQVFQDSLSGFLPFPRSSIQYAPNAAPVQHGGGISWSTPGLSPALIGIGYIIGPKLSSVTLGGGLMAWWIMIPLIQFFDPSHAGAEDALAVWRNIVRPIAVGAMLVSAAYTLFSMRESLMESVRGAFKSGAASVDLETRERDLPLRGVIAGIFVLLVPIVSIYYAFTHGWAAAIGAAIVMTVSGFFLTAVGGYLVGLVGVSNQPLSGLTLGALILAALLMVTIGVTGAPGVAAVLGVAAVVSIAASVSGSLIQDLKAGHLLGGTPWKMQLVEMLAVALLALFLMLPIIALHEANLATGGIGGRALPAPQAGLMAQLAKGIVGGQMAWGLLGIGLALGVVFILCGARAPMLLAVGMYLPFDTSSAIFVGGILKWMADRVMARRTPEEKQQAEDKGTFIASGLIAGEAIVGILLAATFLGGVPSITRLLAGADEFSWLATAGGWLSLAVFLSIGYTLVRMPTRG